MRMTHFKIHYVPSPLRRSLVWHLLFCFITQSKSYVVNNFAPHLVIDLRAGVILFYNVLRFWGNTLTFNLSLPFKLKNISILQLPLSSWLTCLHLFSCWFPPATILDAATVVWWQTRLYIITHFPSWLDWTLLYNKPIIITQHSPWGCQCPACSAVTRFLASTPSWGQQFPPGRLVRRTPDTSALTQSRQLPPCSRNVWTDWKWQQVLAGCRTGEGLGFTRWFIMEGSIKRFNWLEKERVFCFCGQLVTNRTPSFSLRVEQWNSSGSSGFSYCNTCKSCTNSQEASLTSKWWNKLFLRCDFLLNNCSGTMLPCPPGGSASGPGLAHLITSFWSLLRRKRIYSWIRS